MDVLIIPSAINPLDASFPGDGGGCAYEQPCWCDHGSCYENDCGFVYF